TAFPADREVPKPDNLPSSTTRPTDARRTPSQFSAGDRAGAVGVGGVDVLHGRGDRDSEDTDEVDRVFGLAGFVQDSVGANSTQSHTGGVEACVDVIRADGIGGTGGLLGDEGVGVGGAWPTPVPVAEPVVQQGGRGVVEVDDVAALGATDQELPAGEQNVEEGEVAQVGAVGCVEGGQG
ncbi:hypothetical protein, partial [Kitasatospora sp. NPDC058218]|uniref:hypothetical protein n=1 Tax=Kitasatospora sp. NPDC058218 TaxID=3346385 RepID=UPI0036D8B7B2